MSLYTRSFSLLQRLSTHVQPLRVTGERRNFKRWVAPTLKALQRRREKVGPEPVKPRNTYLEWNYEAELFAFGKRLGEDFDRNLLRRAFTQRDYANLTEFKARETGEVVQKLDHNHSLIQEGEKLISDFIKRGYAAKYPKDIVEAVHAHLTSEEMLAHVGKHMGIGDLLLTNEFPAEQKTLSDTFKAVVAALKLSTDTERAEKFVEDFLVSQMVDKTVYDVWNLKDPYGYLTELLRKNGISECEPRLCNQSGVNTILANYQVGLYSDKKLIGIGWGETVHNAKESAAWDAIQKIYENYAPNKP